ncbi:MAG: hypothetical protein LBU07_05225 [Coriobacteriales bacterium]|nr:hypothetical protein [Coriobacteriales bacterium]
MDENQMLSQRRHSVLESVVQEYVQSAHPVGSHTLVRSYLPLISAATVRNELMWLENQGYVCSPHTSAGRIPTNVGYRTFVNSLLLHPGFFTQRVVLPVDCGGQRAPSLATVRALANPQDKILQINETLAFFAGYTDNLLVLWLPQISTTVFHRGLPLLLGQPEFTNVTAALPIMQLLENQGELLAILENVAKSGGLHIRIGAENSDAQLYPFSLLALRFEASALTSTTGVSTARAHVVPTLADKTGAPGSFFGVVALFGPTRMNYQKAISALSTIVEDAEG